MARILALNLNLDPQTRDFFNGIIQRKVKIVPEIIGVRVGDQILEWIFETLEMFEMTDRNAGLELATSGVTGS